MTALELIEAAAKEADGMAADNIYGSAEWWKSRAAGLWWAADVLRTKESKETQ